MQISTVHVYLTYPFVLSWSLLEAMSLGCSIVASDTKPLHEVIIEGENGKYVNFFDFEDLAKNVIELCKNKSLREYLSLNAREHVVNNYDISNVCLPKQINWFEKLVNL